MCESTVFLEDVNGAHEAMKEVARIIMDGKDAVCTDILGEKVVLKNVRLKEANLLSHGIVFVRN
jgi:predicted RNA-binding protein